MKIFTRLQSKLPIRLLLYLVILFIIINGILMLYSNELNKNNIQAATLAERVLFEAKLPHDFSIRDADIALRGFALAGEERFLFATVLRVRLEMEKSFEMVDSILNSQGFTSKSGLEKIEQYKREVRAFNDHQNKLVNLIRNGKKDLFLTEFKTDAGSQLYPSFVDAIEEVNSFELSILQRNESRSKFFSMLAFWLQLITLVFVSPLLFYITIRIAKEKEQDKMAEVMRVNAKVTSAKEEVLSILSHEIRTPLNSVIGLTHVLSRRDPRGDQKEVINTLASSADHLMHIVNDILDFNKIQAKGISLELLPFDLRTVLNQIHSMFIRIAGDKNLTLSVQVDSSIPNSLTGDPTRLTQILSNLVSNGLKFTPAGSVTLNAKLIDQDEHIATIEFVVQDTGLGIAPHEMQNIFLPFKQEKNVHGKFGGTGLGLTIVKNLAELMGGNVSVSSIQGEGSTFNVRIPFSVQQEDIQAATNQQLEPSPFNTLKGKRILYVEDVESNWFLVNSILEDHSMTCVNVENGTKAMAAVLDNKYDVILLDVQLPDMNGFEVARAIRTDSGSLNKSTPIILFSAFTNINEDELTKCGANDLLGKPFKPETLIQKMAGLIGQAKTVAQFKNE
jgi:signal transduction histidine kinase/BarA-like signal transduction histidine kinase